MSDAGRVRALPEVREPDLEDARAIYLKETGGDPSAALELAAADVIALHRELAALLLAARPNHLGAR